MQLAELGLGLLQLLALNVPQHKQQVPLLHLVPSLHAHGADLPGLVEDDLIALVGGDRPAAADFCVDGAGGNHLGGHLGQGVVHDRLGKKGQHQQYRQENDGDGLDEFPLFGFFFHFHRFVIPF